MNQVVESKVPVLQVMCQKKTLFRLRQPTTSQSVIGSLSFNACFARRQKGFLCYHKVFLIEAFFIAAIYCIDIYIYVACDKHT